MTMPRTDQQGAKDAEKVNQARIVMVGGVSLVIALVIIQALGRIYSDYQALDLLHGMSSALQFLGSAVFTALAAILALILTSVSFLGQLQAERLPSHYLSLVRQSAYLAITGMALSLVLLLLTIIPSARAEAPPQTSATVILYYVMIVLVSVLVGVVMMLMLLLLDTIQTILASLPHDLVAAIESETPDDALSATSLTPKDSDTHVKP